MDSSPSIKAMWAWVNLRVWWTREVDRSSSYLKMRESIINEIDTAWIDVLRCGVDLNDVSYYARAWHSNVAEAEKTNDKTPIALANISYARYLANAFDALVNELVAYWGDKI